VNVREATPLAEIRERAHSGTGEGHHRPTNDGSYTSEIWELDRFWRRNAISFRRCIELYYACLPSSPNLYEGIANTNVQLFCFFSSVVMRSLHPI